MKIGQLAAKTSIGIETIRYYERRGLIEEPPRTPSGYRDYPTEAVKRIAFIRNAQRSGFTLREISGLLALENTAGNVCSEVRHRAEERRTEIHLRIEGLRKIEQVLTRLIDDCRDHEKVGKTEAPPCPILSTFSNALPSNRSGAIENESNNLKGKVDDRRS